MSSKQTFVYKIAGDCPIEADVYGPSDATIRPAVVWLHGGALIMGHRGNISSEQLDFYLDAGYRLIALDYRLAPETKLPAIIQDVRDGICWVRQEASALAINPARIAIVGHSAGGYLALMAGIWAQPRPRALIAFYGYGDILGEWYTRPAPFYCAQPLVSREEVYAVIGTVPIATAVGAYERSRFYLYCRQQGLWPQEVSGYDPIREAGILAQFCPVRNIPRDYPPTLLLHGDRDSDVPYEQSVLMAQELARRGVPHELVIVPAGDHGFDLRGFAEPATRHAFDHVRTFLSQHL